MGSIKSSLKLNFVSLREIATEGKRITKSFLAIVAIVAVALAGSPTTGEASESSKASTDSANKSIRMGSAAPDGQSASADAAGVNPDLTLIYSNVRPGVTYRLTTFVLYNTSSCREITAGNWYGYGPAPSYGFASEGYYYGYLANGDCPGVRFKFRSIYYTWTHDKYAKHDQFKAYWAGGGYKTAVVTFKFNLRY